MYAPSGMPFKCVSSHLCPSLKILFHPICGTFTSSSPFKLLNLTTRPSINPIPLCLPNSSLSLIKSCMPRQMPKNALPLAIKSIMQVTRPWLSSVAIASPKAPTPGNIIASDLSMTRRSLVISWSNPAVSHASFTLKRFPSPKSTIATFGLLIDAVISCILSPSKQEALLSP